MSHHVSVLMVLALTVSTVLGDVQEHVVVTASRVPVELNKVSRSVVVLDRSDIDNAPVDDLAGLLAYVAGVDLVARGRYGVQSDISIRGSSFDQVQVLIDGVKVGDPQSGHHLLDLPLTLDDLERVEVLKGPASRLYGPNAFGGVVNIITRKSEQPSYSVEMSLGQDRFNSQTITTESSRQRITLSRKASDGHVDNTDFDIGTVFYRLDTSNLRLSAGRADKEFGAYGYYTAAFPGQWEATSTTFLSASSALKGIDVTVSWRRHDDEFLLDREDPDFYRNRHNTDVYSMELGGKRTWSLGVLAYGGELGREEIAGTSLGYHERSRAGVWFEQMFRLPERYSASFGGSAYRYSGNGWELWPGLDAGMKVGQSARVFASVAGGFRVPTYTELYYDSPANVGDSELQPEQSWTYEAGLRITRGRYCMETAVFRRESRNLIDWVRLDAVDPWHAANIGEVDTDGIEFSLSTGHFVRIGYSRLDQARHESSVQSKYSLTHLRHKAVLDLRHDWPVPGLKQNWKLRYEDPVDGASRVLLDTRLNFTAGRFDFYLAVNNLTDEEYVLPVTVPAPGRWISAGTRLSLRRGR